MYNFLISNTKYFFTFGNTLFMKNKHIELQLLYSFQILLWKIFRYVEDFYVISD